MSEVCVKGLLYIVDGDQWGYIILSCPMLNVIGKRAGHANERVNAPVFLRVCFFEAIQPPAIPPKMPKSSKSQVEQEGRILLAISAIKKKEITNIRIAACVFDIPLTTL